MTYHCDICGRDIPVGLPWREDSGKHDPAYHVARAYHVSTRLEDGDYLRCVSDHNLWPCQTIVDYGQEPMRIEVRHG